MLYALRYKPPTPDGVSDTVIQSVALLAPFETAKGQTNVLHPAHLQGMVASLAGRAEAGGRASQVCRLILDYFAADAMTSSIVNGIANLLERLSHAYFEPQNHGGIVPPVARLNALRIELCIRIPRHVALIRAVRVEEARGEASSPVAVEALFGTAVTLAEELYGVRDDQAETALLQDVKRVKTTDVLSTWSLKECFAFQSATPWEAATQYWHVRFLTLSLRLFLLTSHTARICQSASDSPQSSSLLIGNVEYETVRTAQYILKSADFTRYHRPKRYRLRAQSMIAVWGALRDLPQIDADRDIHSIESDRRSSALRIWLLEFTTKALKSPGVVLTEKDMDEASDMLVGGPILGVYARLYRRSADLG